jgi:hypothetical protein
MFSSEKSTNTVSQIRIIRIFYANIKEPNMIFYIKKRTLLMGQMKLSHL